MLRSETFGRSPSWRHYRKCYNDSCRSRNRVCLQLANNPHSFRSVPIDNSIRQATDVIQSRHAKQLRQSPQKNSSHGNLISDVHKNSEKFRPATSHYPKIFLIYIISIEIGSEIRQPCRHYVRVRPNIDLMSVISDLLLRGSAYQIGSSYGA